MAAIRAFNHILYGSKADRLEDVTMQDNNKRVAQSSLSMWLCQSSDNLTSAAAAAAAVQMVNVTDHAKKAYCSLSNLTAAAACNQHVNEAKHGAAVHRQPSTKDDRLQRVVSLDAVHEEEPLQLLLTAADSSMPYYYWNSSAKAENDEPVVVRSKAADGKGNWKRQSALMKGICDLASGERLKMWKAKLPLVNRGRANAGKLVAVAVDRQPSSPPPVVINNNCRRLRKFGQHSPNTTAMDEGNYDVPVTPNRFDSNAASTQVGPTTATSYNVGRRMVNANPYYQQQQQQQQNGQTGLMTSSHRNRFLSHSKNQGHQSVADSHVARYLAEDCCSYDNPDSLMLTASSRRREQQQNVSGQQICNGSYFGGGLKVSKQNGNTVALPSPVKIIACGGVPVNTDQPRLVKPSAFRPVQPAGWQTAKAARISIGMDGAANAKSTDRATSFSSSSWSVTVNGHGVDDAQHQQTAASHIDEKSASVDVADDEIAYDVTTVVSNFGNVGRLQNGHFSSPQKNGSDQNLVTSDGVSVQHQQPRQIASRSSRNSSGIQITPSPSDSGVAEYEAALREKDAEIVKLRNMMEHNEQVIIRVYQEKEERWQEKLRDWSNRLQAALHNEKKLLSQMQCMQQERKDVQDQMNNLFAEKQGLLKMIRQLEKEVFELRNQFNVKAKQWCVCQKCSEVYIPHSSQKEKTCSQVSADALRNELDALRLEVCEIRHSLQSQPTG